MAAFRWIKISLFLTLMLQFIAARSETRPTFLTVRDGNEVTLPCGNRRDTHDESDGTSWFLNDKHTSDTKTLVKLGNYHREIKTISERLSVTANGSLLLRNVTEDNAGRYTCKWITSGQTISSVVYLSVVTIIEQENPDSVALFCSVVQYDDCLHEVEWIYEGKEEKPSHVEITQHFCSATVTFPTSHLHQKSDIYQSLTCKATNTDSKSVHLFPFSPQSSEATQSTPTHHWTSAGSNNEVKHQDLFYLLRWIVVSVGLAALVISVVIINLWSKTKGNKKQNDQNLECSHEDEEEGVEIYEN